MTALVAFFFTAVVLPLLLLALLEGGRDRHPLERQRLRKRPTLAEKLKAKGSLK